MNILPLPYNILAWTLSYEIRSFCEPDGWFLALSPYLQPAAL